MSINKLSGKSNGARRRTCSGCSTRRPAGIATSSSSTPCRLCKRCTHDEKIRPAIARGGSDSGILKAVPRKPIRLLLAWVMAVAAVLSARAQSAQAQEPAVQPAPQTSAPAPPQAPQVPPVASPAPTPPEAAAPAPPQRTLAVVVLDPAHGGADPGARGSSGVSESDMVLNYARLARISLDRKSVV